MVAVCVCVVGGVWYVVARCVRCVVEFGTAAAWHCHSPPGVSMLFLGRESLAWLQWHLPPPRLLKPQSHLEDTG